MCRRHVISDISNMTLRRGRGRRCRLLRSQRRQLREQGQHSLQVVHTYNNTLSNQERAREEEEEEEEEEDGTYSKPLLLRVSK